ncbi:MAG: DUF4440 domain-containing protein [bacterium]
MKANFLFQYAILLGFIAMMSCLSTNDKMTADQIIALEKAALDRWGNGDVHGYLDLYAEEITYFDPDLERRKDGIEALKKLIESLEGKIKIDRYEMINPNVQIHGNTAVLTFNLIDFAPETESTPTKTQWNSTEVYAKMGGTWKIIHSHWSYVKPNTKE